MPESDNVRERLFGEAGVAACNAALSEGQGKSDDVRRSRLMLARAVHHVEVKDLDAALADVRAFPAAGGERAEDPGFRRSLALSALDLEAAILLRMGRPAEAEAVALRMAAQSPLDLVTQVRAALYLEVNPGLNDAKRAFYANLVRQLPEASLSYATAQEWASDYAGAAVSIEELMTLVEEKDVAPSLLARLGALHILAGASEKGAALINQARKANEDMAAGVDPVREVRRGRPVSPLQVRDHPHRRA